MASSMQQPAPGCKSSKFVSVNPLDPFIKPFDNEGGAAGEASGGKACALAESLNRRLEEHVIRQRRIEQQQRPAASATASLPSHSQASARRPSPARDAWENDAADGKESDSDDLEDDDDDAVLASIRERRLEEMREARRLRSRNEAKGPGEVRTISQDEFLPECLQTASRFVAVHFFHSEFERCRILDHHLGLVAARHPECKFLRIDAEKAPFFVGRLSIRTLPALLVFEKGQVVDRLVGFNNLGPASVSSESDPDRWKTSRLQAWLGRTGAIDYEPGLRDDEDSDEAESDDEAAGPTGINRGVRLGHVRRGLASLRHGYD